MTLQSFNVNKNEILDTAIMHSYNTMRIIDSKRMRKFIREHNVNDYQLYTNKHNNFVALAIGDIHYTFNGFSKEDFLRIYKEETGEDYE